MGATHGIDSKPGDAVAPVKKITDGGADQVLGSTGNEFVFRQMAVSVGLHGHGALVDASTPGTKAGIDIDTGPPTGLKLGMLASPFSRKGRRPSLSLPLSEETNIRRAGYERPRPRSETVIQPP